MSTGPFLFWTVREVFGGWDSVWFSARALTDLLLRLALDLLIDLTPDTLAELARYIWTKVSLLSRHQDLPLYQYF